MRMKTVIKNITSVAPKFFRIPFFMAGFIPLIDGGAFLFLD
jgi:hypothetical protein